MKSKFLFSCALAASLFAAACSSASRSASAGEGSQRETAYRVDNPQTLADILIRVPGVFVDERGAGTQVTIRGGAPLFVIDGVPVGNTYAEASSAVSVQDIASVEVLKSASETMIYGSRAASGVILIRTGR